MTFTDHPRNFECHPRTYGGPTPQYAYPHHRHCVIRLVACFSADLLFGANAKQSRAVLVFSYYFSVVHFLSRTLIVIRNGPFSAFSRRARALLQNTHIRYCPTRPSYAINFALTAGQTTVQIRSFSRPFRPDRVHPNRGTLLYDPRYLPSICIIRFYAQ